MGLLSPAAYDAILLEKVKLLLQAALQNPKRRGPPTSYEHFVEALDVNDESSLRVMEVLLHETTTRRPRKLPTSAADPTASTSTSSNRRTRDTLEDDLSRLTRRGPLIVFSDSDSDSDELTFHHPTRSSRLRPVGIRSRRDEGPSPSLQLRQQQIDELFGYTDPLPSFSQVLSDFSSSSPAASQPSSSVTISTHSPSSADLPTFEELWNILLDDPFPSASVTTFTSFLDCLNASSFSPTPLVSNTMPALLRELSRRDPAIPISVRNAIRRRSNPSGSGTSLPSFREFLQQDPPSGDMNRHEVQELARLRRELTGGDSSSGGSAAEAGGGSEGIWRTSFIEHLEDGTEREMPVDLDDEVVAPAMSFVEHARRRRAERRQREEEGANPPAAAASGASDAGISSTAAAGSSTAGAATPSITVTSASTPATSAASSPPRPSSSAACPSLPDAASSSSSALPPPPPPPPRTSASIAEDHFRRQRRIARLPSPFLASTSASEARDDGMEREAHRNPSLRAVVDALSRSRARRAEGHGAVLSVFHTPSE